MNELDVKRAIEAALRKFANRPPAEAASSLFEALGYTSPKKLKLNPNNLDTFKANFAQGKPINEKYALPGEWRSIDFLFQLTDDEIRSAGNHQIPFQSKGVYNGAVINSYLFFALELKGSRYTRTQLAGITSEINKLFAMPALVLFRHGETLTLAIIPRRQHKREEGKDVLEKVTLIQDIRCDNTHRAHIEILFDLSLDALYHKYGFSNFVELQAAWQKTLDTSALNKRFYQELANWYFWALDQVSFPDDIEKDKDIRNATSLIRLITRITFIWFIKEKDLVQERLFDRKELSHILKDFFKNKQSHSYYQAILQNLFFGTLNQKMTERGFAREGSFDDNKQNYGVKTLFRYADQFAISEGEALALFKDIPFLNGGLFDCLDKENDEGKVLYADGFSRNPKKQAIVPDFLFFGGEEDYDLNQTYGTKSKKYKVKGLFEILSAYKFTITENTPIEEEIALDPELLGKVFENLLAAYNPETGATARKQTGSFYTPREIVNYMVDESLKAYLKQKLETQAGMKPEDAEIWLDFLIGYNEREHLFDETQTAVLINAIDACKILDPACGSGAFPMGVLHKMVHILHKLDPQNRLWKERQVAKVKAVDDAQLREVLIADIEAAFANNELDYGRKLYLIENCIYGVDIQPIAIQISKLRFFISLIVDQKTNTAKENYGIRSLPNLETKFVAANTLIGLEKPKLGSESKPGTPARKSRRVTKANQASTFKLENLEIVKLKAELKELRHQYFNARTRKEKLDCQKKDKDLRKQIAGLLMQDGWGNASAKQVADFDPYDQNASSPFFEVRWKKRTPKSIE